MSVSQTDYMWERKRGITENEQTKIPTFTIQKWWNLVPLHNNAKIEWVNGLRYPHSKDSQLLRKLEECFHFFRLSFNPFSGPFLIELNTY